MVIKLCSKLIWDSYNSTHLGVSGCVGSEMLGQKNRVDNRGGGKIANSAFDEVSAVWFKPLPSPPLHLQG